MKAQLFASCLLLAASASAAQISVRLAGVLKGEVVQMGRGSEKPSINLGGFAFPGGLLDRDRGGDALELRPWVDKRDDRRAVFARRSISRL